MVLELEIDIPDHHLLRGAPICCVPGLGMVVLSSIEHG